MSKEKLAHRVRWIKCPVFCCPNCLPRADAEHGVWKCNMHNFIYSAENNDPPARNAYFNKELLARFISWSKIPHNIFPCHDQQWLVDLDTVSSEEITNLDAWCRRSIRSCITLRCSKLICIYKHFIISSNSCKTNCIIMKLKSGYH